MNGGKAVGGSRLDSITKRGLNSDEGTSHKGVRDLFLKKKRSIHRIDK